MAGRRKKKKDEGIEYGRTKSKANYKPECGVSPKTTIAKQLPYELSHQIPNNLLVTQKKRLDGQI